MHGYVRVTELPWPHWAAAGDEGKLLVTRSLLGLHVRPSRHVTFAKRIMLPATWCRLAAVTRDDAGSQWHGSVVETQRICHTLDGGGAEKPPAGGARAALRPVLGVSLLRASPEQIEGGILRADVSSVLVA